MPGKKTNKLTVVANEQAQLLDTVIALRQLMSLHDNVGYILKQELNFINTKGNEIREEAMELANNTGNKIHELLQCIENTKLYREMAAREKRRRNTHGSENA